MTMGRAFATFAGGLLPYAEISSYSAKPWLPSMEASSRQLTRRQQQIEESIHRYLAALDTADRT